MKKLFLALLFAGSVHAADPVYFCTSIKLTPTLTQPAESVVAPKASIIRVGAHSISVDGVLFIRESNRKLGLSKKSVGGFNQATGMRVYQYTEADGKVNFVVSTMIDEGGGKKPADQVKYSDCLVN